MDTPPPPAPVRSAPSIPLGSVAGAVPEEMPNKRRRKKQAPNTSAASVKGGKGGGGGRAPSTGRVSSVANAGSDLTDEKLEGLDDCLKRCASRLNYVPDCFSKLTVAACFGAERLGRSIDAAGGCPKFLILDE